VTMTDGDLGHEADADRRFAVPAATVTLPRTSTSAMACIVGVETCTARSHRGGAPSRCYSPGDEQLFASASGFRVRLAGLHVELLQFGIGLVRPRRPRRESSRGST